MISDQPLVICVEAGRSYGTGSAETVALEPTSCQIVRGQRVALTGQSGSGKSTLLHLMAGLDEPSTGEVSWPAIGARAALRPGPIAVVFQGPSLLPPLSVIENVALPLQLAGRPPREAMLAARAALTLLGLDELADKLPEELSGGQAQRAAIVRALASEPQLILADEPTSQLDRASGKRGVELLLEVATRTGAALVVATHDDLVAAQLAERWRLTNGVLEQASVAC